MDIKVQFVTNRWTNMVDFMTYSYKLVLGSSSYPGDILNSFAPDVEALHTTSNMHGWRLYIMHNVTD